MEQPIVTFSSETAIPAIENNIHDLFKFVGQKVPSSLAIEEDISWIMSKPFWPNFLFEPNFKEGTISQRLENIVGMIKAYRIPPTLFFGPMAKPYNLIDFLERYEFECFLNQPGMAADLSKINDSFSKPPDLYISVAESKTLITDWINLNPNMFDIELFEKLVIDPKFRLYIGILNGRVVARSILFLSAGVAGIYHIFVPPEFRGQGIGTAITLAQLIDARKQGYRVGILTASQMGEPIYKKIGFKEFFRHRYFRLKTVSFNDFMKINN
jgi:predicted GNAT family acetyltransferase